MVIFYIMFIKNFKSLISPIIECIKGREFSWKRVAQESFQLLKKKITTMPILVLPDFKKLFEVDYDASHLRIGVMLSQNGCTIALFSENLNEVRRNYSTYDVEFYAIIKALRY